MLQNYFQIDLLTNLGNSNLFCITDIQSGKIVATFPINQLKRDVSSQKLLETFKSIFHEPASDDQGVFISYTTAKNRTLDILAAA